MKLIDSAKYGLPAMGTHNIGMGTFIGHEMQSMATRRADMRRDGLWKGQCPAGVMMCPKGVATFSASGVGNMAENGG